jgi:hypothetical protein
MRAEGCAPGVEKGLVPGAVASVVELLAVGQAGEDWRASVPEFPRLEVAPDLARVIRCSLAGPSTPPLQNQRDGHPQRLSRVSIRETTDYGTKRDRKRPTRARFVLLHGAILG